MHATQSTNSSQIKGCKLWQIFDE